MNAELDQIREQLVRIEQLLTAPKIEPMTVTAKQAQVITGHTSKSAFYEWAQANELFPCKFGAYLTKDVTIALHRGKIRFARAAANDQGRRRSA